MSAARNEWMTSVFKRLVDKNKPEQRRRVMLSDRIEILYRQGPIGVVVHTIVISALTYLFWDKVPSTPLIIWASVMLLLGWARGAAILAYKKSNPEIDEAAKWGLVFVCLITLVGVTWGYAGVFIVPDSTFEQVMFILLLGGTAAGTVSTLASLPILIVIALSTSVIPLIIRLATEAQFEQQLMSGALVMYFMAMMATGRNSGSMVDMAFSLKLENTELITSLERERHELDVSNRAKTKFLAAASHDLRQPLHAMNLTVAAYRIREKSKGLEPLFDRVDRSVQAMEGLVNSLLDISKLDAGTVDVKTMPVSVDEVISAITAEASEMVIAGNCRIMQEPSGIEIDTDPRLLGSIVRNLLGNAIRHAPGSTINLSVRRRDNDEVVLCVSDDGPGIEPHLQERVFEEFYQADSASPDQGGLGLGLAIVKRLSTLLGGSVSLSSKVKHGARFEVLLPGHMSLKATLPSEVHVKVSPPALNDLCVAVLEDDKDSQAALLDLVCAWGCEALAGRNADEIKNSPHVTEGGFVPQVIISDFQLGRSQEGPTEIAELRKHFNTPELPAVLLTGDSSPERLRQLASVQLDVLHKPVNPNTLADLLGRLVD